MHTFEINYRVTVADGEDISRKVEGICLEQSVELPRSVLSGEVETKVVGQVTGKKEVGEGVYDVTVTWPKENAGNDISQFLNILYGNISLQPGIRVTGVEWSKLGDDLFGGPAFGISMLRQRYGVADRPFSATALKPLGSSPKELGELCFKFACGGIDIIKDDHGLANQDYAPFDARVKSCVEAIRRAEEESGNRARYFPNVTALASDSVKRYELAAEMGADGVLICPHIAGMETMHEIARMDIPLPIIAHPAFSGGLTTHEDQGLTPSLLYGQLWRGLGADFVVYPNVGGRFSFSEKECKAINDGARNKKSPFKAVFPVPAGGMQIKDILRWRETYGKDTVFLLGGSLYDHPRGVKRAAQELMSMIT